jgi:hypothetical protein
MTSCPKRQSSRSAHHHPRTTRPSPPLPRTKTCQRFSLRPKLPPPTSLVPYPGDDHQRRAARTGCHSRRTGPELEDGRASRPCAASRELLRAVRASYFTRISNSAFIFSPFATVWLYTQDKTPEIGWLFACPSIVPIHERCVRPMFAQASMLRDEGLTAYRVGFSATSDLTLEASRSP